MVKILGFNGKLIIAILYVYFCEINAGTKILEARSSSSENKDGRRSQATKKKTSYSESKHENEHFRNSNEAHFETHMSTRGFRADIKLSPPKHYPRHGRAHIEPVLRNFEDPSSDSDSGTDKNTKKNKYYVVDWSRNKDGYLDPDDDHKMDKNHNKNRNPTMNKDKSQSKDKSHNKNKHSTAPKDPNIDMGHSRSRGTKDHNADKNSNNDKNKNHIMSDKSHNKDKNHHTDKTQDTKMNNKMKESHENDHTSKKYPKKERHRDKSHDKDAKLGGPMRIPKLHPEPVQGRILALEKNTKKSDTHHHRSKLRTHSTTCVPTTHTDETLESTRMTQMYLMNQDSEHEGNHEEKVEEIGNNNHHLHPTYLSPYSIQSQMNRITKELSASKDVNITIEHLGHTVEYNDLIMLKITENKRDMKKYFRADESKYIDEVPEKKIIFIVHGLSVMGMTLLDCLNAEYNFKILVTYYLYHLDQFDIFLIPMANPDGYAAGFSSHLWNKNASPQESCRGVMLDRNFDVAWNGTPQVSPCSQLYPGPNAFSEIETKAIRDVFHYHGHKILAYIHVHAGTYTNRVYKGDAILYPRGYSESTSDDDKYVDLKGEIDEAMKNASFQVLSVTVDTLYNWYGRVTGSSVDYASTVYGIPYAFEFVMQLYENDDEDIQYLALTEIWNRLIETTFNNMWKSLHTSDVRRKSRRRK